MSRRTSPARSTSRLAPNLVHIVVGLIVTQVAVVIAFELLVGNVLG